jgi:hypothetical protein
MPILGYEAGPISLPFTWIEADEYSGTFGYDQGDGSANDVLGQFVIPFRCVLIEVGLIVTDQCDNSTTQPVYYFDQITAGTIPTENGDVGIITIVDETPEGDIVYDVAGKGTILSPGEAIEVSLQTAPVDASAVEGDVIPYCLVYYAPETNANLTNKTETA